MLALARALARTLPALAALLAFTPIAQAASGGIDSFWASASQVKVGDTVDFSVAFSLGTTSSSGGGSNPTEPVPQEGYQEWNANWSSFERETLTNVWLQVGDRSFSDYPSLAPGNSYANTWSFSVKFTEAGSFNFDLSGGWQANVNSGYSNESASRNCHYNEPDGSGALSCDSWYWQYSDADDHYTNDGSLSGGSLRVDVLAVPEPGTWALMLAGAGLLALRTRRRR